MKLLILVLNKIEVLDDLLLALTAAHINGATIISSTGMAHALSGHEEVPFLLGLRALLDPDREQNRTIFAVIEDSMVETAIETIDSVVGDLSRPDTGIVFTLPIDQVRGIHH